MKRRREGTQQASILGWKVFKHKQAQFELQLKSPVPHLHLSNYAPSIEEEKLIQKALDHTRKRYQEQMHIVSPPEIKLVDQFLRSLKDTLSPLRRLPTELLQEIFICGSEGPAMRTYFANSTVADRAQGGVKWPWTLSQVCRRWREVCIATPELWNYLPVLHIRFSQSDSVKQLQTFVVMIQRSQGAQLHVFVHGPSYTWATHPILDVIIKESDRWETAVLSISEHTFKGSIPPLKNRLRQLKCLNIAVGSHDTLEATPHDLWDAFSEIPSLRKVGFNWYNADNNHPPLTLTRSVTTFINFNSKLDTISLHNFPLSHFPSVTLPCLKRLMLRGFVGGYCALLNSITLPSLEELIINVPFVESFTTAIFSLITRSTSATSAMFPLKNLHIRCFISYEALRIVTLLPNLRVLEFPLNLSTVSVVNLLASPDPYVTTLPPRLEFLKFSITEPSYNFPELYDSVCKLAKLRCEYSEDSMPFVRLKALTIECEYVGNLIRWQRILQQFSAFPQLPPKEVMLELSRPVTTEGLSASLSEVVHEPAIDSGRVINNNQRYLCSTFVVKPLHMHHATNILKELRLCRVKKVDVLDIYTTQAYTKLQVLDTWIESNVSKVKWKDAPVILKDLQTAIRDMLMDWSFALDEYSSKMSWAAIGHTVLVFVPSDHPIRSCSRSIEMAQVYEHGPNPNPFLEMLSGGISSDDTYGYRTGQW